jgi:hypothetical protein
MLIIRRAQIGALEGLARLALEQRLAQHLRDRFPGCRDLDADGLRALVQHGLGRAAAHGVQSDYDVRRFLEFVAMYGPSFDTDPRIPWAGETLRRSDLSGTEKMDRLDSYDLAAGRASG